MHEKPGFIPVLLFICQQTTQRLGSKKMMTWTFTNLFKQKYRRCQITDGFSSKEILKFHRNQTFDFNKISDFKSTFWWKSSSTFSQKKSFPKSKNSLRFCKVIFWLTNCFNSLRQFDTDLGVESLSFRGLHLVNLNFRTHNAHCIYSVLLKHFRHL